MSKIINCVVDTQNKKERERLVDFVCERIEAFALIDDSDGFQLMMVRGEMIGNIGVISARNLVTKEGFRHFLSVGEFEKYHIIQEIGEARYEIYEKYGLKPTVIHRAGTRIIMKNNK